MRILVLASGGIDSSVVVCAMKRDKEVREVGGLFINYGQQAQNRERRSAGDVCRLTHVGGRAAAFHDLDVRGAFAAMNTTGPLMTGNGMPDVPSAHDAARAVFVPARNTVLLSLAMGFALGHGYDAIAYGPHGGDATTFMDCRPDYVRQMQQVAAMNGLLLTTPLLDMSKAEVIQYGASLGLPFNLTHSCYRSGAVQCGRCPSCRDRIAAFEEADILDPLLFVNR